MPWHVIHECPILWQQHRTGLMQAHLDDYDAIKLINYIRSEVAAGRDPRAAVVDAQTAQCGAAPWAAECYLAPALAEDPLITYVLGSDDSAGVEATGAADGEGAVPR